MEERGGSLGTNDDLPHSFWRQVYTFRPREQAIHSTFRLEILTDAILAIAATVLVLSLNATNETPHHDLIHQFNAQRATLVSVLLGFLWITGNWVLSHRSLRQLRGADHYMTLFVVAGALNITLIPFATSMLAHGYGHRDFWVGVEAVSVVILIGNILSAWSMRYAHRRGLMKETAVTSRRQVAMVIWYSVLALAVIAVAIARFAPWVALSFIVVIRISAVLPLSSDRRGLPGDVT